MLDDVREGNVSPEAAERDYGVVVVQDGRDWTLDEAATAARRKQMQQDTAFSGKAETDVPSENATVQNVKPRG